MNRDELFQSALKAQEKIDELASVLSKTESQSMRTEIENQIREQRLIVNSRTAAITKIDRETD
jgi:hypothetical protein